MSKRESQKLEKRSEKQAVETDIPSGIVKFLERRNGLQYPSYQSRYSVTDIVGCTRKAYYKELGVEKEELIQDATLSKMWSTVRGDFLHEITRAYKWRELDTEFPINLEDGRTATVAGRLDMYDWKTRTIIDLKTTKFVKWQIKNNFLLKPEHILQVQCYDTIFSKIIPVENLILVYVDTNDMVAFQIKRRNLSSWITKRVKEIEESLSSDKIPKGQVSGLCQFCKYQNRCYDDGDGLTDKPLSIPAPSYSDKNTKTKVMNK